MSRLQRVYDIAPVPIQNLMVSARGAVNSRQRYGATYWGHRAWLREFDSWGLDRMLEYQTEQLRDFIRFAATNSQFYRELYADIDWRSVTQPKDLPHLPIVEKEQLRANMQDAYTVDGRHSVEGHTGGTTGKSLVVRFTNADDQRRMAMLDHFKARHGFENRSMRRATFSGKHIVPQGSMTKEFWRLNAPNKQMLYSTFNLAEVNLEHYVSSLNDFKPMALDGFFTSMCDIANYIERRGLKLRFHPVAIFPTSETVTPRGRELLERVFQARVFDQYASSEGAPFVTECSAGRLHSELSTGVFENYEATDEILVTSFATHGTPLIRYRIGDSMSFATATGCACGSPAPVVESIQGRSDDFLFRADGGRVNGGHVANLFKNMPNALIQAKAIQIDKDAIRILLLVDELAYAKEFDALLHQEFLRTFGPRTRLTIEHVDAIPRETSGKQRLICNLLAQS